MALPDMAPPAAPYRECRLTYTDGSSRTVYVTEIEVPFPEGRLIVSRTDLNGIITHANDAFVEMSGWSREELIGAPHHILRHPDMPKVAFKGLWDDLKAGKKWHGYVKNLRKDGSFYWVYATAVPNIRNGVVVGYTSVRRKPSRTRIAELEPLYRQWLAEEKAAS
ncbi:aerotaxis receptor [Tibeticola sediminis]|jgi:aerotaxis receptor|uniref:Aerotaxis receptor n=1 Tax=Tibeticola sediminis TaxID=1917811 RepID=A0A3N4UV89_9BURK|nr:MULTISPECIES: PAS domain-containing protein [Tibeticola]MCI4441325.1 PAS domain-containing protein [Tibeticola sp.]RPE72675.1 aerotaxis receptor [Tibeticola sediminis]